MDEKAVLYCTLPSIAVSTSSLDGFGFFLSKVYMDITNPGEQYPHWDPWRLANRSCGKTVIEREKIV